MSMDQFVSTLQHCITERISGDMDCSDRYPFSLTEFCHCLVMECIQRAWHEKSSTASIRSHLINEDETIVNKDYYDSHRKQKSRTLKWAQSFRTAQHDRLINLYNIEAPELLPSNMDTIERRKIGHQLTPMQFLELNTMQNVVLLDSIASRRICNSRHYPSQTFNRELAEYDSMTAKFLNEMDSPEDIIFRTIALYDLEWKYQVELFYRITVEAEKYDFPDVPLEKVKMLCAPYTNRPFFTENRFILKRIKLVPFLYGGQDWQPIDDKLQAYLQLKCVLFQMKLIEGKNLLEYFVETTGIEEWAAFLSANYDISKLYVQKELNLKRIRYIRQLYDKLMIKKI